MQFKLLSKKKYPNIYFSDYTIALAQTYRFNFSYESSVLEPKYNDNISAKSNIDNNIISIWPGEKAFVSNIESCDDENFDIIFAAKNNFFKIEASYFLLMLKNKHVVLWQNSY